MNQSQTANKECILDEKPGYSHKLSCFQPVSIQEVQKIIRNSPSKSCNLDPLPTSLLKECLDELAPIITEMINTSIMTGKVSAKMKEAVVTPLLKKANLALILKNFRPVSNLTFISKTIERFVASPLTAHMKMNGLIEMFQSAYRECHSTETALIRVQNDILHAMDKKHVTILVLLDLSAAFDTVDHSILIRRLEQRCGITGTALDWLISYLKNRKQTVSIDGELSDPQHLDCGVPQ